MSDNTDIAALSVTRRVVTGHDENTKSKVLYDDTDGNFRFQIIWSTDEVPVDLSSATANDPTKDKQVGVVNGGSVCSVVWLCPDGSSPMHRTKSIDYGVVLEGEIEIELDNGDKRALKTGEVIVQRGTVHAWHNRHATKWAKVFFVLVASKSPNPEA